MTNGSPSPKPDPAGGSEPICDPPYKIDNGFDQNDLLNPPYQCIMDPKMQDNKGLLGAALNDIRLGGKSKKKNTRRRRRKTTHRHHRKSQRKRRRQRKR